MSEIITATITLYHDDEIEIKKSLVVKGTWEQLCNHPDLNRPEYDEMYIGGVEYEPNLWPDSAPGGNFCRLIKETPLYRIYENEPYTFPDRYNYQATPDLFEHYDSGWGNSFETLEEVEEKALAEARDNINNTKCIIEDLEKHLP